MSDAVKIYRFPLSGHSHRVELFASLAGLNFELVDVKLGEGEHKKEAYLSINPMGQVPAIQDGDVALGDSNAILVYLARKYAPDWLPTNPVEEAEIQQILSLAAGEIANGPAAARLVTVFGASLDVDRAKMFADRAFGRLEKILENREWLVAGRPTIADVAVYSYTKHAPEGNISLEAYPNIRGLLSRIEALDGFVPMPATAVGLAAE